MQLGAMGSTCAFGLVLRCVTQVTVPLILMDYICGIAYNGGTECINFNLK